MELEDKQEVPEQSLRDSIAESITSLDSAPVPDTAVPAKEAATTATPVKEQAGTKTPATTAIAEVASIKDTPPVTTEKTLVNARGPASWKPDVREKWNALPPEVKVEVLRRETETSRALQESSDARKFVDQFHQVAAPYQHYIALEGNDPMKAFGDYLRTASLLRGGTPMEKANAVASAITTYGIDVQMLDTALSQVLRGAPAQVQQQQNPQQFRDPRLDELLGQMQARQASEEQEIATELAAEVEAFAAKPENEFFDDLRGDIGDLLRFAASRNQKMTLQEAYDKAAKLHPTVSSIVEQRGKAKAEADKQQQLKARRNAASTVTTRAPRQTGNLDESSVSVRAAIENSISGLST